MTISRYSFTTRGKDSLGSNFVGISDATPKIHKAVNAGLVNYSVHVLEEGERLDYLAGIYYGDSSLWWILAAASSIGYALQVPPGTIIKVPSSLGEVLGVLV